MIDKFKKKRNYRAHLLIPAALLVPDTTERHLSGASDFSAEYPFFVEERGFVLSDALKI